MTISSPRKALDKPFSEIISSSNETVIAQCYKEVISNSNLNQNIIQGTIVKAISSYDTSYAAFGIIAKINNTSLDNIHKPSALGLTPKELEHLQPQVYDLLRKELEIHLFAYKEKEQIFNHEPTTPLMVHDFVYFANQEELILLTENLSSIINLIKKKQLKIELLTTLINEGYKLRDNNYKYLVKVGQELTLAFSDEIDFLIPFLKRLSQERSKKSS